jgi:hypothetical protein
MTYRQSNNSSNSMYRDGIVATSTNLLEPSVWVRGGLPNGVKSFQPKHNLTDCSSSKSANSTSSNEKSVWMNHSYPKEVKETISVRPTSRTGGEQRPQLEAISDDEDY